MELKRESLSGETIATDFFFFNVVMLRKLFNIKWPPREVNKRKIPIGKMWGFWSEKGLKSFYCQEN